MQYCNDRALHLVRNPNRPSTLESQKLRERTLPPRKILLSSSLRSRVVDMSYFDRLRPSSGDPCQFANAQLRNRRCWNSCAVLGHILGCFCQEVVHRTD